MSSVSLQPATERTQREAALTAAHFNTNLLPHDAIQLDLMTDSWAERWWQDEQNVSARELDTFVRELFGCAHVVSVSQGRMAEAIVAAALATSTARVFTNSIFPTAQFHLSTRGADVLDITAGPGSRSYDPDFPGNIDVEILRQRIHGASRVWLEACSNASFGAPFSLENLDEIRSVCAPLGVPIILDASRMLENVLLYMHRRRISDSPLHVLRKYRARVDVIVMSGTKDFKFARGGFIATNIDPLAASLVDLSLAYGGGLAHAGRFAGSIPRDPFAASRERVGQVNALHAPLVGQGVLASEIPGGHGVFIDVGRVIPKLAATPYAVPVFLNQLFLNCGVRGGEHFYSAMQRAQNRKIARLAVPVGIGNSGQTLIAQAIGEIQSNADELPNLSCTYEPPGLAGKYGAHYTPLRQEVKL